MCACHDNKCCCPCQTHKTDTSQINYWFMLEQETYWWDHYISLFLYIVASLSSKTLSLTDLISTLIIIIPVAQLDLVQIELEWKGNEVVSFKTHMCVTHYNYIYKKKAFGHKITIVTYHILDGVTHNNFLCLV